MMCSSEGRIGIIRALAEYWTKRKRLVEGQRRGKVSCQISKVGSRVCEPSEL